MINGARIISAIFLAFVTSYGVVTAIEVNIIPAAVFFVLLYAVGVIAVELQILSYEKVSK